MAKGTLQFTVHMTMPMTNDELAEAITAAYNRAGSSHETQRKHQKHMDDLLAIQLARASMAIVEDDDNTGRYLLPEQEGSK